MKSLPVALLAGLVATFFLKNVLATGMVQLGNGCSEAVAAEIFREVSTALFVETRLQGQQRAPLYITLIHQAGVPGKPGQLIHCMDCNNLRPNDPVLICQNEARGVYLEQEPSDPIVIRGVSAKPLKPPVK